MALSGEGHGKLILFGEHAAVHGFPAVGVSLAMSTSVRIESAPGGAWSFPGMSTPDAHTLRGVAARLAPTGMGGAIEVTSTVPRSVGFGSSAALCVALAAALRDEKTPYGDTVWSAAHVAESVFHGRPSGIDTGLALHPGFRSFRPAPPGLPAHRELPPAALALVVGATPRRATTRELVAGVAGAMEKREDATVRALERLGALALDAERWFLEGAGDTGLLGGLAEDAQRVLAGLGLSTPETDALLERGRSLGCLGGKLSGGGGGGALYLVCRDADHAASVAAGLVSTATAMRLPERAYLAPVIFGG